MKHAKMLPNFLCATASLSLRHPLFMNKVRGLAVKLQHPRTVWEPVDRGAYTAFQGWLKPFWEDVTVSICEVVNAPYRF